MPTLKTTFAGIRVPQPFLASLRPAHQRRRADHARLRRRLGRRRVEDHRRAHHQRQQPLLRTRLPRRQDDGLQQYRAHLATAPSKPTCAKSGGGKTPLPQARRHRLAHGRVRQPPGTTSSATSRRRRRRWPRAQLRLPARHERARHGLGRRPGARICRAHHRLGEGASRAPPSSSSSRPTSPISACPRAAKRAGADALSAINTINSITSIDLDTFEPRPMVDGKSSHGGYCGPAVKPIALNMVQQIQADPLWPVLPMSPASAASAPGATRPSSSCSAAATCRSAPRPCTTAIASSKTWPKACSTGCLKRVLKPSTTSAAFHSRTCASGRT